MADQKLTALALGTRCGFYYGEEGFVSKKYNDQGIFNVLDNYGGFGGADPTGVNDSAPAIQAAVDAAKNAGGGTVFFPLGTFKLLTGITFSALSGACLRIVGTSGGVDGAGTIIRTPNRIWMFYVDHTGFQGGGRCIASIEGISFYNDFNPVTHGTILGTEVADGGFGCLYLIAGTGLRVSDCGIFLNKGGIGIFDTTFMSVFEYLTMTGPGFAGGGFTHAEDSYGIITYSGNVRNCRINDFGRGIMVMWFNPCQAVLESLDIETCGCAISVGTTPIKLWTQYSDLGPPHGTTYGPSSVPGNAIIRNVNCESNGTTDNSGTTPGAVIWMNGALVLDNVIIANFSVNNACGFELFGGGGLISNMAVTAGGGITFTTAGIHSTNASLAIFFDCSVNNALGTAWSITPSWQAGAQGIRLIDCDFNGAVTFAQLPTPAATVFGAEMVCSNSPNTGFGQAVSPGGGTNTVIARWNGTAWVVA